MSLASVEESTCGSESSTLTMDSQENYVHGVEEILQRELVQFQTRFPLSSPVPPPTLQPSKRFKIAIMIFLCFINVSLIRCNISIAVVKITNTSAYSVKNNPKFDWDSETVGVILGASYYGELMSFLCGYATNVFGGAASSTAFFLYLAGAVTVFTPATINFGFYVFIFFRVLTGIFVGAMLMNMREVLSIWFPQSGKTKLTGFVMNGLYVGVFSAHMLSTFLANKWGWKMIFYSTGLIATLTAFLFISLLNMDKELAYRPLESTPAPIAKGLQLWRSVLSSTPIWALIIYQFILTWMWSILNPLAPVYFQDLTNYDLTQVALFSSVPIIGAMLMLPNCASYLDAIFVLLDTHDELRSKMYKIMLSAVFIAGGILFEGTAMIPEFSVIFFALIQMLQATAFLIIQKVIINIAPCNKSLIGGICAFVNALSNILSCRLTGVMTTNYSSKEWSNCFLLASFLLFIGAIIFGLFGSTEAQPWSESSSQSRKSQQTMHDSV